MKYLILIAIAVGLAAMPAEAAKKIHKSHEAYGARAFVVLSYPDPSGGNAAAAGNNANSMSGNHSAGANEIGRTNAP
jgi:hypothetical protein